jgi:ankyrin repeat protein
MSAPKSLPPRPDMEWLRKAAKARLAELRTKDPNARLHQAQFALAQDYGFASWRALKAHIDGLKHDGRIEKALPFDAGIAGYEGQADALLAGWRAGDKDTISAIRRLHPKFLREDATWLEKPMSEEHVRSTPFELEDARLATARWYEFLDWAALAAHVAAVTTQGSPIHRFEAAVEAVVGGDIGALKTLLANDPGLIRARSQRITSRGEPAVHGATLLHYIAANGVESYRQKSPPNAAAIAKALLEAGAEVDAVADMYGGKATTMSMLASSTPPHEAGTQVPLGETLIDHGAALEPTGTGAWTSPLLTALAFGFIDFARMLARRGARVETLSAAAGLGLADKAADLLPAASALDRHRALALAAQLGHRDVVLALLNAGEDPNRYNPAGNHAHSTPLHQAALAGHEDVVRLLVERGARLDIPDKIYDGTPSGWAHHGGRKGIADYLRAQGG